MLSHPNRPERLELGEDDSRRVYFLKTPTLLERPQLQRALTRAGARQHGQLALCDCLRRGVAELMAESPDELREQVLAKIDAHRENLWEMHRLALACDLDNETDKAAFAGALKTVAESGTALAVTERAVVDAYEPYASMMADEITFHETMGIVGARLFLMGWEGIDGEFRRVRGEVMDASLECIPPGDFAAIGAKLQAMTNLTEKQRKNSSSPPITPNGGETSSNMKPATNGTAQSSASASSASTLLN